MLQFFSLKLEHLCRCVARPGISAQRLAMTRDGRVRYALKPPYRDGTTHVIFESSDFLARLPALAPKPRVNLIRFHGVFAPNSLHRATITPAKRNIFIPLFTTKRGDSGIGMSIVQQIMRLTGGSIHVASAPGAGTTVNMLF